MRKTKLQMKKPILLVIITLLFSCNNEQAINLEGNWVITEMEFEGKKVYPQTLNEIIKVIYFGQEGAEKITFNVKDSIVILPGFKSEKLNLKYQTDENEISLILDDSIFNEYQTKYLKLKSIDSILNKRLMEKGVSSTQYDLAKSIYIGTYQMIFNSVENTLELKSDKTIINMISEAKLIERAVNQVFDGL